MKKDIHPEYREVVFFDAAADFKMLTRSTVKTSDTTEYEGKEYPVFKMEISSASHPFFTGQQKFVDTMGRVQRFQNKFGGKYFGGDDKKSASSRKPRT